MRLFHLPLLVVASCLAAKKSDYFLFGRGKVCRGRIWVLDSSFFLVCVYFEVSFIQLLGLCLLSAERERERDHGEGKDANEEDREYCE